MFHISLAGFLILFYLILGHSSPHNTLNIERLSIRINMFHISLAGFLAFVLYIIKNHTADKTKKNEGCVFFSFLFTL